MQSAWPGMGLDSGFCAPVLNTDVGCRPLVRSAFCVCTVTCAGSPLVEPRWEGGAGRVPPGVSGHWTGPQMRTRGIRLQLLTIRF